MFLGGSCREPRGGKAGGGVWRRKAIQQEGAGQDGGDGSKCRRRGRFSQFIFILYIQLYTPYYTVGAPWLGGRQGCPEVQELPWLQEQEEMRKSNAVLVCHGA